MEQYADEFERECAELRSDNATLRARLAEVEAEREAYKNRGDNHAETLRGVRAILAENQPDIERALLWISDGLFGYTESLEATLLKASDERNSAIARATRAEARVEKLRDGLGTIVYECQQNGRGVGALKRVVLKVAKAALADCEEGGSNG